MAIVFVRDVNDNDWHLLKVQAAKDSLTVKAVFLKLIALYIHGKVKLV